MTFPKVAMMPSMIFKLLFLLSVARLTPFCLFVFFVFYFKRANWVGNKVPVSH